MNDHILRFYSPPEWARVGSGRFREADLSAERFARVLDHLGTRLGEVVKLVACRRVRSSDGYRPDYRVLDPSELAKFVGEGWWQFFVWLPARGPDLGSEGVGVITEATLSLSGLINLQCGRNSRGAVCAGSIGIVPRIRSLATGAEVVLDAYQDVYRSLSNILDKLSEETRSSVEVPKS